MRRQSCVKGKNGMAANPAILKVGTQHSTQHSTQRFWIMLLPAGQLASQGARALLAGATVSSNQQVGSTTSWCCAAAAYSSPSSRPGCPLPPSSSRISTRRVSRVRLGAQRGRGEEDFRGFPCFDNLHEALQNPDYNAVVRGCGCCCHAATLCQQFELR